jgi:hypothetical protein
MFTAKDAAVAPTHRAFDQDWVGVLTFEGNLISAIDESHDHCGILAQPGLTP